MAKGYFMKIIKMWKEEEGHTVREMGRRIGVSGSHICRAMHGKKTLGAATLKRLKEVRRLEHLIRCEPADVMLLRYELEQVING
jgi:transcriptional regulator with XRE-family HTH domain